MNIVKGKVVDKDEYIIFNAVPALSPLTFQSVHQNFTGMLLSPKTLEIFFRKPGRPLIIHVLEDTGTISILFPWLLTCIIITYKFYHSIIMTCQRKHVIIQAGKHLNKKKIKLYMTLDYLNYIKYSSVLLKANGRSKSANAHDLN